jgi:hypothetical protein
MKWKIVREFTENMIVYKENPRESLDKLKFLQVCLLKPICKKIKIILIFRQNRIRKYNL